MYQRIQNFLQFRGTKYISPDKAGDLRDMMLEFRALGQAARKEFTQLAKDFQERHPELELHSSSQWMNQAQILRPHFWAYLQGEGSISQPMFALRLYGDANEFGVSLEVSFLERKKDEHSLEQQAAVLEVPIKVPVYYFVQENGESQRVEGIEDNRLLLREQLAKGQVRKVLVKQDVSLASASSENQVLDQLDLAFANLKPFYEATRR
ncbi:hypothetical protein [Streptococcus massiliensis]|uniref:Sakacin A production response regulator n=1 Tax=Streptococcus massiliensis TaxID=313439 RepID=A0A380KYQ2_9STRE|nr:hypothetical protein [Streptococcus massiliensis]SUN77112.1 sakacin A production response regulator [Streptococcus massiliensis]